MSPSLWNLLYTEVPGLYTSDSFGNFIVNIECENVIAQIMGKRRSNGGEEERG